jgi:hypothetical protein
MLVYVYPRDGGGFRLQFIGRVLEGRHNVDERFASAEAAQRAIPRHLVWARQLVQAERAPMLKRLADEQRQRICGVDVELPPDFEAPQQA